MTSGTLFGFGYYATEPGEKVTIFGNEIVKRPTDTISITIQHEIEETGDKNEKESVTVVIEGLSFESILSKPDSKLSAPIIMVLPKMDLPYAYSITGTHTLSNRAIRIIGNGKLTLKHNQIYKFSTQDADSGTGWKYSLVEL